jgi:RimJ/RimL family protein N-acetyltransferase
MSVVLESVLQSSKTKEHIHLSVLYQLLAQRKDYMNISHEEMPTWEKHVKYVRSQPHKDWFMIYVDWEKAPVGSIYLSKKDEVGIFILEGYQGRHIGETAIRTLLELYPLTTIWANIAPNNVHSEKFFRKLGFKEIQHVYKLARSNNL